MTLIGCTILKIDNFIDWNWREVFLSCWIFLGLMIGVTLIITLAFFDKFMNFFLPDRRNNEGIISLLQIIYHHIVFGLLWLVLIFLGTSVLSCLIILKLQKILENHLDESIVFFLTLLISKMA